MTKTQLSTVLKYAVENFGRWFLLAVLTVYLPMLMFIRSPLVAVLVCGLGYSVLTALHTLRKQVETKPEPEPADLTTAYLRIMMGMFLQSVGPHTRRYVSGYLDDADGERLIERFEQLAVQDDTPDDPPISFDFMPVSQAEGVR
jgi:hypothetical protein